MARVPATERRALLAQAALRVLSRDGLAAVTTRAVVAEAGMKLASFHYAYASRTDLLRDLVTGVVEGEREGALLGLVDQPAGADLRADLVSGLRSYLALVRSDPGREQGMFELTQHALRDPDLADLAAEQYARYHALAAELLSVLAERHGIDWDTGLDELSRLLVALTDGITLGWLATRDDVAAGVLAVAAADALAAHVLVPVGAR